MKTPSEHRTAFLRGLWRPRAWIAGSVAGALCAGMVWAATEGQHQLARVLAVSALTFAAGLGTGLALRRRAAEAESRAAAARRLVEMARAKPTVQTDTEGITAELRRMRDGRAD